MAINMDKMRKKLQKLESRGANGKSLFWKPQDGEQVIRIVPDADGDPFREFWFHYNLGDSPGFLSPKRNFGEDDALDRFVRKLFDEGTEESRDLAKKLMAKQRFFSPVVIRGEEEKGVRLWGYSKTVYQKLLSLVLNPEYGDITDPESGTDLTLKYGKAQGAIYPSTDIFPSRRTSELHSDRNVAKEMMDTEIDYDNIFSRKSVEDVQQLLNEFLSGDDNNSDGNEDMSKYSTENIVEKAFSDLLA
jgi:hypothetical protein